LSGPASQTPPLIFEGPKERDAAPLDMALQPGEERTFCQPFEKNILNSGYRRYLVEAKLLVENFDFMRDGKVRIIK
jgi:hypothetical protein